MDEEHCSVDILNWLMYRFAFEFRNYFESLHMGHVHSTTLPTVLVSVSSNEVHCHPLLWGALWWLWSQRWTSPEGRRHPKALHDGRRSTSEMLKGFSLKQRTNNLFCTARVVESSKTCKGYWGTPVGSILWPKIVFHHAEDSTCRTDDGKHGHTWDRQQVKINQYLKISKNDSTKFCSTNWQHISDISAMFESPVLKLGMNLRVGQVLDNQTVQQESSNTGTTGKKKRRKLLTSKQKKYKGIIISLVVLWYLAGFRCVQA